MEKCVPICRVCMQKSPEYFDFDMPLQNENEEDTSITYLDFFFECTRIEVELHEGGSQCFCLPCANELRSFYEFIRIAEMTDKLLKENNMEKERKSRKNDSTFEIIEWEPESEDDYMPQEDLLNESIEELPTESEEDQRKEQSENSSHQSFIKETVENQLLVHLRVEICQERRKSALNTISTLNSTNSRNSIATEITSNTLNNPSITQKNKKELQSNLTKKTYKKGPVECTFCHEILKNRKRLDKHLIEKHQRRTQPCEICGKMVIRMHDHLLIHYRQKNDISRPKTECPICLRKVSKQTISRHIRYVHKHEIKKQKCQQCLQTFADAHKLKIHLEKGHTSDRIHKCPLCSRIFSNTISLNNHLRTHPCLERKSPENTSTRMLSCANCPMQFSANKILNGHSRSYTANEYNCEICGQIFSGTRGLRHRTNW